MITRNEVISMAREAGKHADNNASASDEYEWIISRDAHLVELAYAKGVADAKEQAAQICDAMTVRASTPYSRATLEAAAHNIRSGELQDVDEAIQQNRETQLNRFFCAVAAAKEQP